MATYDPNKRYTWTPTDKFELSGAEFGLILNAFRALLAAVERALAAAVEADVVKEAPETPQQANL
jgi:hypothetical protein